MSLLVYYQKPAPLRSTALGLFYYTMAKDTFYFSHDYNTRNDEKIKFLIRKHGMEGYGIFWAIIEDLYNNANSLKSDYDGIAYDLRVQSDTVKSIINDYDLFVFDGDCFGSLSVQNRIEERDSKSLKARKSALKKWGRDDDHEIQYASKRSERLANARKLGTHTAEQWDEMRTFFSECVKCGSQDDIVKDHIVPIYLGGSDSLTNIQPLCRKCNSSKGSESVDYRMAFINENACEIPAHFFEMPAIKESKGKEIKEKKESKGKEKKVPHLFEESFLNDILTFKNSFVGTPYESANFEYYQEIIGSWAKSKAEKKADWVAAARNWMARDLRDGKFIDNKYKPNGNSKTQQTRVRHITDQQLHEAFAKRFGSGQ